MRVVGVDPGQNVGLVTLDILGGQVSGSRFVAATTMHATRSEKLTHAERDANLFERLTAFFVEAAPDLVVLEEPFDASTAWRGHSKQQRGTAARLGTYYGLCVCAAKTAAEMRPIRLASYPVTNQRNRPGWMRGKKREYVLRDAAAALTTMGAGPEVVSFDLDPAAQTLTYQHEHILMATGVVVYHLSQLSPVKVAGQDSSRLWKLGGGFPGQP